MDYTNNLFHQARVIRLLPDHERSSLYEEAISRKLQKGEYLTHQGDIWPYLIFVLSGQIQWAMLATSGKEHVLFNVEAGHSFWGHSIFDDGEMPASLYATKNSEVLLWERETILRYLRRYPDAMWETTGILTMNMRQAREIIYNLAFQPVAGRLATLLLDQYFSSGAQIERNFTLSELAARVAATPEVVCRLLYQFQEDGVISITRASIEVHDKEALEKARDN